MVDINVENLGSIGLNSDLKPYELEPEAWSRVVNIRFGKDGAQKMTGHIEIYDGLGGALHAPYWIFPWESTLFGFSWIYAGTNRIGRILGNVHSDITRFTTVLGDDDYLATATSIWSGTLLGDLPVLTYDGNADPPQSWNSTNGRLEDLPNWQANTFCDIIRTVSNHLVALRVAKAGFDNPRLVKWSQAADPGTYPSSWDETDPSTGAGEVTLAATKGEIQAGEHLGNSFLIYKTDSVITMRFVGGQSVFRFDTIFSEFGALARHCVGVLEDSHIVVTETDVIQHNGTRWQSIIDDRNRKLLFGTLSETFFYKTLVSVDKLESEVWFMWADTNSLGELNRSLVWNYVDDTWSIRDIQDFAFAEYGRVDLSTESRLWDDQGSQPVWNNYVGTWQRQQDRRAYVAADALNSKFYLMNEGNLFDTAIPTVVLERSGLGIVGRDRRGQWRIDLNTRKFLRRFFPTCDATLPIDIYLGGQERVDGPVDWQGPFTFDPNTQTHIDVRINTRFLAVRFESTADDFWSVFGYGMDLDVIGQANR